MKDSVRNGIAAVVIIGFILIPLNLYGCQNSSVKNDVTKEVENIDSEQVDELETTSVDEVSDMDSQTFQTERDQIEEVSNIQEMEEPVSEELDHKNENKDTDLKDEEEPKQSEEERLLEEKKIEEEKREKEIKNSFSMMYYLAFTAENIRTSKENRLLLDDIYTSLLNDINPGAIDETTQDHLKNLRDIIKSYINISTKRERLQFIYNQQKAAAMRNAVPNPLAVLSMSNALDWKKLAMTAVYTVVDSYNNYKKASESADTEFLMSGWDLDDEELATVQKNRDRAFDYMVDMVQEHNLDGLKTFSEKDVSRYVEICAIESPTEKIKRLRAEEDKYELFGNYWLELADCYFETDKYSECLDCVDKYNQVSTGIYRKDVNYLQILPKAIVAAQNTYKNDEYVAVISEYADAIISNTTTEDWSTRYFAAQVYLDLYSKTNDKKYINKAYKIVSENVAVLLNGQRELNKTYMDDVVEVTVEEPDYKYLTKEEKKEKEKEYKEEKKRVKAYNKQLKKERETEFDVVKRLCNTSA